MLTKWLGVLEAALLLGGLAGLLAGAYLLATSLLPGLIVIVAMMVLLFCSVSKVAEAQERTAQTRSERRVFFSPQRGQSQCVRPD